MARVAGQEVESALERSKRLTIAADIPRAEARAEARRLAAWKREAEARPAVECWRLKGPLRIDDNDGGPRRYVAGLPVMRINRPHLIQRFGHVLQLGWSFGETAYDSGYVLPHPNHAYSTEIWVEVEDDIPAHLLEPMDHMGLPLEWRALLAYSRAYGQRLFHSLYTRTDGPLTLGDGCEFEGGCLNPACTEALRNDHGSVFAVYVCREHDAGPASGLIRYD